MQIKYDNSLYNPIQTSVFLHRVDYPLSKRMYHYHDSFEIYLSLSEDLQVLVGNKTYPAGRGHLYVFNNLDIHKPDLQPGKMYDRYIIQFKPEYIKDMCTEETDLLKCFTKRDENFSHCIILSAEQLNTIIALFDKAIEYHTNESIYAWQLKEKLALVEILIYINTLYRTRIPASLVKSNKEYEREYKKIKTVIDYININVNKSIYIKDICTQFHISKRHLETCFKLATGFTIKEYVLNRKIENAKQFLKQDLLVAEVSKMTGFKSVTHFIRSFKARTGITPKQYVKNST